MEQIAKEIHMAQINYVQELISLDKWMQCNDQGKNAKNNNAKQIIKLLTLVINCNQNKTLTWELHA